MADIPNYTDGGNGTILISEIKVSRVTGRLQAGAPDIKHPCV